MKLQVVTVLGICLAQMCIDSVNSELTIDQKNDMRKGAHEYLGGVSERFIDDALTVIEKFEDDYAVKKIVTKSIFRRITRVLEHEKVSKIDVDSIMKYKANQSYDTTTEDEERGYDALLTYQSILLKRVPAEIANGMLNLVYAITFPNATTEDMENAVNYLYSNETMVIKDPFRHFQVPNASKCPRNAARYSAVQDKLKAMTFIKPSVLEDVAIIIEKFPCSKDEVPPFLVNFVEIAIRLQSIAAFEKKPISACLLKEHLKLFNPFQFNFEVGITTYGGYIDKRQLEHHLKTVDPILATRLTDERFRDIINLQKAAVMETPVDETQKALEYAFVDVAPSGAECSNEEHDDKLFEAFYSNFRSQYNKEKAE